MDENNVNNQEGYVYVVGTRGYSAYEVAVQNGFEGTVDEWLASLQGEQGPEGPAGPQGNPGPTGLTPSIRVGSVTTGEPNTNVEINITGTPEVPIVNFKIPKGAKGDKGDKGDTGEPGPMQDLSDYYTKQETNTLLDGKADVEDIPDLTDYVKNTDYATTSKGGVIKTDAGAGVDIKSDGRLQSRTYDYNTYRGGSNNLFISKGTLENVLAGKELVNEQALTDYVKNTDYASAAVGGVIKINSPQGTAIYSSGVMYALTRDYSTYSNDSNGLFISKGTLENVLAGKELVNEQALTDYVKNTDYATPAKGGLTKAYSIYGISYSTYNAGGIYPLVETYEQYTSAGDNLFIGKGTLENVLAGKELVNEQALTDYVKNTDYASAAVGGVIKLQSSYGLDKDSTGNLRAAIKNYTDYENAHNRMLIGKETLENVFTGKDFANKQYVDDSIAAAIGNALGGSY